MQNQSSISNSTNFVKSCIADFQPQVVIILGSGIGFLAEQVEDAIFVNYADIPEFPVSTVEGHIGRFVFGSFQGKRVVMMQGRFHFYEGYSMQTIAQPIRLLKTLGAQYLIVTNAAGAVNTAYKPGDLMLIKDQINFSFKNPLIGENDPELGPRFPDTQNAYDKELRTLAKSVAEENNIKLHEGIYMFMTGPTYETPAEVRMAKTLGADVVGMSTVPEVITAAHCGLNTLGITFISNLAAGLSANPLSHDEVVEAAVLIKESLPTLIRGVIEKIAQ